MASKLTIIGQLRLLAMKAREFTVKRFNTLAESTADTLTEMQNELDGKQPKLSGKAGQVVGFDESGNAVAQDAPQSGVTMGEVNSAIESAIGDAMKASYGGK